MACALDGQDADAKAGSRGLGDHGDGVLSAEDVRGEAQHAVDGIFFVFRGEAGHPHGARSAAKLFHGRLGLAKRAAGCGDVEVGATLRRQFEEERKRLFRPGGRNAVVGVVSTDEEGPPLFALRWEGPRQGLPFLFDAVSIYVVERA